MSDSLDHANDWEAVHVPHTWQYLGRSPDYVGVASFRIRFEAPASSDSQHLRVQFEADNHTAAVFLNGRRSVNTPARATPRSLSIYREPT